MFEIKETDDLNMLFYYLKKYSFKNDVNKTLI